MRFELSEEAYDRLPPARALSYEDGEGDCDIYFDHYLGRWTADIPTWWHKRGEYRWLTLIGQSARKAYRTSHETKRIKRLVARLNGDGFKCQYCGERIPLHRNANARFCTPSCAQRHYRTKGLSQSPAALVALRRLVVVVD